MTSKELLRILMREGWFVKNQKGSHIQLIHPEIKGKITIPHHKGDIPKGTLRAILKQAYGKGRKQ
ncbi:MAG: type II toxin-antitoxin system HicA family toxin [Flavobacteriales bacterium]